MVWADDPEEAEFLACEAVLFTFFEMISEELKFGDFVFVEVDEASGFVFKFLGFLRLSAALQFVVQLLNA